MLLSANDRRRRYVLMGHICSFQEEAQWFLQFQSKMAWRVSTDSKVKIDHNDDGDNDGTNAKDRSSTVYSALSSRLNKVNNCRDDVSRGTTHAENAWTTTTTRSLCRLHLQVIQSLPRATWIHSLNAILATFILMWFLRHTETSTTQGSEASIGLSNISLYCLYFSQLGLIYDNMVNAVGQYVGEGSLLRTLNQGRFVWHITSMPLLGIPLSEWSSRQGLWTESTASTIASTLLLVSAMEFIKWTFYFHPERDLKVVDLRHITSPSRGPYLPGTLAYTSGKIWEMVVPPVLLVCCEIILSIMVLMRSMRHESCASSDSSAGQDYSISNFDTTSGNMDWIMLLWTFCRPAHSDALLLSLCGLVTLLSSAMAFRRLEIQPSGELLHGVLLWSACTATGYQDGDTLLHST